MRRMLAGKRLFMLLAGVGGLLTLGAGVMARLWTCPEVPLEKLLVDAPLTTPLSSTVWKISTRSYQTARSWGLPADDQLGRAWTLDGESTSTPQITARVSRYGHPLAALSQYLLFRGAYPSVEEPTRTGTGTSSQHSYLVCELGPPEYCQTLVHVSWHGQYLLYAKVTDLGVDLESIGFAHVVSLFEQQMSAILGTCR